MTGALHLPANGLVAGTDQLVISGGNVGIGTAAPQEKLHVAGNVLATNYLHSSDKRLKKNIETAKGLDIIKRLRGVVYRWIHSGEEASGVIAQEVEEILPYAVHTDSTGMKSVDYDALIGPMIEAIKEQQRIIEQQQNEIQDLRQRLEVIENRTPAKEN